jgi:hypothetical protein
MKAHLNYLRYVLRHKWFVFLACLKMRVPLWQAIVHDWDKFMLDEWLPYVHTFYKPDGSKQYAETPSFARAWNAHQKRNKHHWQYWLLTWDRGETVPLEMPEVHVREMIADWIGAGRAIAGRVDPRPWYEDNRDEIILHPGTRRMVERLLDELRN